MKTIHTILMAGALAAPVHAKTLTIGIDLSGSNPLLSHENFAYSASAHAREAILQLNGGDVVRIRTFGARSDALNLVNHRLVVSRRNKPEKIAQMVGQFIRSLPEREEIGQSSTNLVAWLEFTDGFGCDRAGEILVITDGLESSTYVEGKDLVSGKQDLPEPDIDLSGCTLTFYGLGAGWPPQEVKTVRKAWSHWSKKAGANFSAVIP